MVKLQGILELVIGSLTWLGSQQIQGCDRGKGNVVSCSLWQKVPDFPLAQSVTGTA